MANRGGKREGAGRKPRAVELAVAEQLRGAIGDDVVYDNLLKLIKKGNIKAIELYLHYTKGKPVDKVINVNTELKDIELTDGQIKLIVDNFNDKY